jgi:uncharacterized membrane protein YhhN
MKKIYALTGSLFVISSIVYLIAAEQDLFTLRVIFKPLILISLIGYYWFKTDVRSPVFLLALLLSCAGDTFLLFEGQEIFFMLGLGSFLLAHVCYIFAYRQHRSAVEDTPSLSRIRLAFPFILAGTGLLVILFPRLGGLKFPVAVYATVLTTMVVTAIFRMGQTTAVSFWLVFAGSALFFVSDSVLAMNKFLSPINHSLYWVMITYCAAQFLIVQGIAGHSKAFQ